MSIKRDILTTTSVRIFRVILGFAASIFLARYLRPEGMGLLASFVAVPFTLASLSELGVRQSIAYYVGQKKVKVEDLSGVIVTLWLFTSIASFVITLIIYYFQGLTNYGIVFCVFAAGIVPVSMINKYADGIALGNKWVRRINIGEGFYTISRLLLVLILVVLFKLSVMGALGMEALSLLVPGVLMLYWLRKDCQIRFSPTFNYHLISSLLRQGIKYAIALFVISLNYRINILILQHYVDNTQIGYFSIGVRLAELLWIIPSAVGMVVFSHSAASIDSRSFSLKSIRIMKYNLLLCSVGAVIIAIICPFFVRIVFGQEYLPSVPIIRLMLPGIVAMVVFKVLNADLAGRGKPLFALNAFFCALVINILLNVVLVPDYGAKGSAIASTASYVLGSLLFLYLYLRDLKCNMTVVIQQQRSCSLVNK